MMPTIYDLPPPDVFGLPSKFDSWRPGQEQAITTTVDNVKRFTMLNMPTGSGKSLVYMAIAALHGGRTIILTATKGLQEQLERDFSAMGLVSVRGQNSYPCIALEPGGPLRDFIDITQDRGHRRNTSGAEFSVEDGPCHAGIDCPIKSRCHYFSAVDRARHSQLVVTNYAFWMNINAHTPHGLGNKDGGLGVDLLILDEAHDAPDQLAGFAQVELSQYEVHGILHSHLLEEGSSNEQWRDWGGYHLARVRGQAESIRDAIQELKSDGARIPGSMLRQLKSLGRMARKLEVLAGMSGEWVVDYGSGRTRGEVTTFSPLWPGPYAERYLFLGVPKVVLVSATIRPRTAHYLGIPEAQLTFQEYPSTFLLAHRPLIHIPTASINHRTDPSRIRVWLNRVDQILRARQDRRGIIHTVSYQRERDILQASDYRHVMMTHESGMAASTVARFKVSPPPAVLVSPSMTTGWDFPDDQCRYQIMVKVPFVDTRGELMKARVQDDDQYGPYLTMLAMIQAYGRGVRSDRDWCETFIIDDNIRWFIYKYRELAPTWFMDAYRSTPTIPSPPSLAPRPR